jgi:poly(A) polymerase
VLEALDAAADTTRLVGGAVRDALLGLPVSDFDLATRLTPAAVVARLEAAGVKAVPTGIAHGTVTAISHGQSFEITTLRRDVATDGRHAVVEFSDDWRDDAGRRDFTINALYANPVTLEVSDFHDGLVDLRDGCVRFIGEPLQRIAEDHLRILRFFRFQARFGSGAPDAAGLAACTARANDLMALSRERVRGELLKLLAVRDPVPTIAVMLDHRILAPVLPEITTADRLARLVAVEVALAALVTAPDPWLIPEAIALRRLAALLPSDPDLLDAVATRLRLSNHERARLVATAAPAIAPLLVQAYRDGAATAADRLLLAAPAPPDAALLAALEQLRRWHRPALPVSGKDMIARGTAPGPEVSRRLASFEAAWIAADFPADPATIERLLAS